MSPTSAEAQVSLEPKFSSELLKTLRASLASGFARNVFETYATRVMLMGVTLLTTIVVARFLGPEGRGLYAVAAALGSLGVQFGNLGLHTANVYYASRAPEHLPSLIGNSLLIGLGGGTVLAALGAVLVWLVPNLISLHGSILVLGLLWVPLGITYLLIQDLLLGVHDVRSYNLLEIVNKTLPLVLMTILVLARLFSVTVFFATTVVAIAGCMLWGLARLRSNCSVPPSVSIQLLNTSFHYAVRTYLVTLFTFFIFRADLFMVQHMLGATDAGLYSIASSMADSVWLLAVVVGTILLPKLSSVPDLKTKLHLTQRALVGIIVSLLPLLVLGSILSGPVIRILFGAAFIPSRLPFIFLMPGMLFLGIETVAMQFLNSVGCPASVVWVMAFCAALNFISNLWAIPRYGISGASVVSSLTYFVAAAFVLLLVWRIGVRQPSIPQAPEVAVR
jgi:O-antigen/teichoic acid export membrane protein